MIEQLKVKAESWKSPIWFDRPVTWVVKNQGVLVDKGLFLLFMICK